MKKLITKNDLLEDLLEMKNDLEQQQNEIGHRILRLEIRIEAFDEHPDNQAEITRMSLEQARLQREYIHADLEAIVYMLEKHDRRLARL